MKKILFALALVIGLAGCQKTDTVTPSGQVLATQIQADIKKAIVFGPINSTVYIGSNYVADYQVITFDSEIMTIGTRKYNLSRLITYDIIKGTGQPGEIGSTPLVIRFYF